MHQAQRVSRTLVQNGAMHRLQTSQVRTLQKLPVPNLQRHQHLKPSPPKHARTKSASMQATSNQQHQLMTSDPQGISAPDLSVLTEALAT